MNPTKLSDLIPFLKLHNLKPKRSLSQNFLVDQNIVTKIVDSLDLKENEPVIEIGPGLGALTNTLLKQNSVFAIEKDTHLASLLPSTLSSRNLNIYNEDVLEFDFKKILSTKRKIKLIGNLPYHISSPILQKLADNKDFLSSIIIMVQKDYATRLTGKPNTSNYSSLTIFTDYHFKKEVLFHVSPHCFYPKPTVDSSIIKLTPLQSLLPKERENHFFSFVQKIFQKKRKMLRNSIDHKDLDNILRKIGFTPQSRPSELNLKQYLMLFDLCSSSSRNEPCNN